MLVLTQLRLIETYPQLIAYDTDVFDFFKQQYARPLFLSSPSTDPHVLTVRTHLCKLDLNLTYPQTGGHFPSIRPARGANPNLDSKSASAGSQDFVSAIHSRYIERSVMGATLSLERREQQRAAWKREAATGTNDTINPWYGCFLYDEIVDFALNFTFPWSKMLSFFLLVVLTVWL